MKKISIKPSFAAYFAAVFILLGKRAVIYALPIAVHEISHIVAMILCGYKVKSVSAEFCGLTIDADGVLDYKSQAVISLAGPLSSIAFAVMFQRLLPECALVSLMLGLLNFLPLSSLDGYGVLSAVLYKNMSFESASASMRIADIVSIFILAAFSLAAIIITRCNISALVFTSYIFFMRFLR